MRHGELAGTQGMRYARTQPQMWSGQCPYFSGHAAALNMPQWRKDMLFERWHLIGERTRFRYPSVYKLYWKLNSQGINFKK